MWIGHDELQAIRSNLRVRSILPPLSAIGALRVLGYDRSALITTALWENNALQSGSVEWSLLSKVHGGLSVVQASSGGAWEWRTDADPEDAKLVAYWVPMREIASIEVGEVEAAFYHSNDLLITGTWRILIRGRDPITIPLPDGQDGSGALEDWMTKLQGALRQAESLS